MAGEGWFGGGADLTPCYLNDGDVEGFHRFYKDICDRYDQKVCPQCVSGGDGAAEGALRRIIRRSLRMRLCACVVRPHTGPGQTPSLFRLVCLL